MREKCEVTVQAFKNLFLYRDVNPIPTSTWLIDAGWPLLTDHQLKPIGQCTKIVFLRYIDFLKCSKVRIIQLFCRMLHANMFVITFKKH